MNKETINKAAEEFAEREYGTSVVDRDYLHKGFYHGAQWRMESVWHDMGKDVPQVYGEYENKIAPSIPCLVKGYLSTGYGYGVRYWNVEYEVWDNEDADDYECDADKIEKWAYLDDLLPDGNI